MSPSQRGLLFLLLFAAFFGGIAPPLLAQMDALRMARSAPLQSRLVRQKLSRLPAEEQQKTEAQQLQLALERDTELERAEERWTRGVGALLSPAQQKQALSPEFLEGPSWPPPPECPGVEGDIAHLAERLIEVYGYQPASSPEIPDRDPWVGPDRRSRSRALVGMVQARLLEPSQAASLLALSLELLEVQRERAENRERMEELLPVVMGEASSYDGDGGER